MDTVTIPRAEYERLKTLAEESERAAWLRAQEDVLRTVWDNDEDAIYDDV